jgi:uncharacterized protein (TIGR04255 family)
VFDDNPLVAAPPEEVPLSQAPLVRVIAQVRFPTILSIGERSFVASFQEKIRTEYPVLQPEQTHGFVITPQGLESTSPSMMWRFIDKTEQWRVSLASEFLSLETTNYSSRTDFLQRFNEVLMAADSHIKPQILDRLGLRYIARLTDEALEQVTDFVRPEIAGLLGSQVASYAEQAINDSLFTLPGSHEQIYARWGRLPVNVTIDPTAIEPIAKPSWILDLDMFTMPFLEKKAFEVAPVIDDASRFAERLYTFFRWVVTRDFLRHFGGKV